MIGPPTLAEHLFRQERRLELVESQRDWAISALARMDRCAECGDCQCANDWPDPKR